MNLINELRRLAQAATPGPWVAKNVSGAGLEIYMSYPLYPDKEWPAFGTDSAFCKKGLVSYETWTQFPHDVRDAQQSINAKYIAAANPAVVSELLDRLEAAEKERGIDEQRIADLMDELNRVGHENDALRAALEKIADWYGSWGPYPETNKSWCAMAIVTAREAVKPLILASGAKGE